MARRGRCRCGNILVFHRGPQGYKMRCPQCLAVVRLNAQSKTPQPKLPPDDVGASALPAMHFLDLDNEEANNHGGST